MMPSLAVFAKILCAINHRPIIMDYVSLRFQDDFINLLTAINFYSYRIIDTMERGFHLPKLLVTGSITP